MAAIFLFGAWTCLRYSFGAWAPDADIAAQVDLVSGIRHHGLGFIQTWRFTPDNWLLSLTPWLFVVYGIFGATPHVVVGFGWVIFLVSVGLNAWLAYRIAGLWTACAVAAVTIFPSFWDLGDGAFMTFPVTHNVSMAWGLLSLLLAERALTRAAWGHAASGCVALYVSLQSDPWSGAALAAPLLAVSAVLAGLHRRRRAGLVSGVLCAGTAAALLLAMTKCFGLFWFLPSNPLVITGPDGLVNNAGWLFRILAVMFNIVPGTGQDCVPANVFDFFAMIAVLAGAYLLAAKSLRGAALGVQLVLGVVMVSMLSIVAAFLLLQWGDQLDLQNGRFFPNVYFWAPLLVGAGARLRWQALAAWAKAGLAGYGALLIAAGLASSPGLWLGTAPLLKPDDITALSAFLEKNGLSYGYGGYWETEALAMSWMTHGRVTIHPVGFYAQGITSMIDQTSTLWYLPGDEPAGTKETFLYIVSDGEICPSVPACVATADHQIGQPARVLYFQGATILVYDNPILDKFVRD